MKMDQRNFKQSDTIKRLKGERYGMQCFGNFALMLSESLGLDASSAFMTRAKESGLEHPYESLTVGQFMQIARDEYFKGIDGPLPVVPPKTEYVLGTISVHPPNDPKTWNLLQCKWDRVTFQAQVEGQRVATTSITTLKLPLFKNDKQFLVHANKEIKRSLPQQWIVRRLDITNVSGTSAPCVDISGAFDQSSTPIDLYVRFCCVDKQSEAGYGFMHSFAGAPFPQTMREAAVSFVQRASIR